MTSPTRRFLKACLPPAVVSAAERMRNSAVCFRGNYDSWQAAATDSAGYQADEVLDKVKVAALKVKGGDALYERDSVVFTAPQYSYPLLAAILRAASDNDLSLSILDFGGSLGSSYFQCRHFLAPLKHISWSIVEQENFVRCGRQLFSSDELKFYFTIEECLEREKPNVVLLSSVLQYLPDPHLIIDRIKTSGVRYVIVDRTPVLDLKRDAIVVQYVPASIYKASYPAWIFAHDKFMEAFAPDYACLDEFVAMDAPVRWGYKKVGFKGFLFLAREN